MTMSNLSFSETDTLHKTCAQMISVMTDAVILVSPDGTITRANQATLTLLDYSDDKIIGSPLQKILGISRTEQNGASPDEMIGGERLLDEIIERIEGFMFPREGKPIPVSLRSSSLKENHGEVSGIVLVARDLRATKKLIAEAAMAEAERRKREELQQAYDELKQLQKQLIQSEKMASIGQIAAGVAHEINNPISGIMVYLNMLTRDLENGQLDAKQALKFLTDSQHELKRCSKIIKSLLDFSRQSHPKLTRVDVGAILDEAFSILDYRAKLQDIEVVRNIDPDLPRIRADLDQLKQVFLNLILNAVQAMPQGGRLTIRAAPVDDEEGLTKCPRVVRIDFEDTGYGISEENIGKLFTPFFTTKEKGEGVGLGLAVAYGIVKRHGGDIRVSSSKKTGTTFSVYLEFGRELEKEDDSRGI
jgi:two-component system NtrC family sensor kinase